jgi:hypothetical protein
MARYVSVSFPAHAQDPRTRTFDLVVWALDADATAEDVGAAYELCRQGEHVDGAPDPRIAAFYAALTSAYPDTNGPTDTPWAVWPLHVAPDHVEMNLADDAADEVLLEIERLAAAHGLLLLDPQGGTVYPPKVDAELTGPRSGRTG